MSIVVLIQSNTLPTLETDVLLVNGLVTSVRAAFPSFNLMHKQPCSLSRQSGGRLGIVMSVQCHASLHVLCQ